MTTGQTERGQLLRIGDLARATGKTVRRRVADEGPTLDVRAEGHGVSGVRVWINLAYPLSGDLGPLDIHILTIKMSGR